MKNVQAIGVSALCAGSLAAAQGACIGSLSVAESVVDIRVSLESPDEFSSGFGLASAFSAETSIPLPPNGACNEAEFTTCLEGDVEAFGGFGTANASAACSIYSGASAIVTLQPRLLRVFLRSEIFTRVVCGECDQTVDQGAGFPSAFVSTSVSGNWSTVVELSTSLSCDVGDTAGIIPSNVFASFLNPDGTPGGVVYGAGCTPGSSSACDESNGTQIPLSGGPGTLVIGSIPSGPHGVWDYDGDGRVNQLDIVALSLAIPLTVPNSSDPLANYDLDADGDVDANDIALIGPVFSAADQGVAGDDNGDFVTNCADLPGVLAHQFDPALTVCDAG